MKRLVLSVVLAFVCIDRLASAAQVVVPDRDWEYVRLDDTHIQIYRENQSHDTAAIPVETEGDLVIPQEIKGYIVSSIGPKAFYGCSKLTSVVIPEGVTNIADAAFHSCSSLTNIVIPASMRSIGENVFAQRYTSSLSSHSRCDKLAKVDIRSVQLSIGDYAFLELPALRQVRFAKGDSLTLGTAVFANCDHLVDLQIDVKDLRIGTSSFGNCSRLTDLRVLTKDLNVGSVAFGGCSSLTNVVLTATASATIGESAFDGCRKLEAIELPTALGMVSRKVFMNCERLKAVSFTTNLTSIGFSAFDGCLELKTVELPESLRDIDSYAFYGCRSLESLSFPQALGSIGTNAFQGCSSMFRVDFPQRISTNAYAAASVRMDPGAFYKCENLSHVALSPRQTVIPSKAFAQCESLVDLTMSTNLVSIAENAFEGCSALSSVSLPPTLTSIGLNAFYDCSSLSDFLIPTNKPVSVGALAFKNTKYWTDWPDNSLVVNNTYILGFKGNPTHVELPGGCAEISDRMFEGMTGLKSVTLPTSVKKIGTRAFSGSGIENVALGSVNLIGVSAFENCSNLVSITALSAGLKEIPARAFKSCVALSSIDIPSGVTKIAENAFQSCTALKQVSGCSGVLVVGDFAFAGDVSLLPFRIPNEVNYGLHVFQGVVWTENVLFPLVGTLKDEYPTSYDKIVSVVFSSGMTGIVARACAGCRALEKLEIPAGLTTIGAEAFSDCTSLRSIRLPATITTVGSNAFLRCFSIISVQLPGGQSVKSLFPQRYRSLSAITLAPDADEICDGFLEGCESVTTFEIPLTVTSSGARAFAGCTGLDFSLEIPEGVTSVGDEAFANCTGLKTVRFLGPKPTTVGKNIYKGTTGTFVTGVLKANKSSWVSGEKLPTYWPEKDDYRRKIGWWVGAQMATVYFSCWPNCKDNKSVQVIADGRREISEDQAPDVPDREGFECNGIWYTAAEGGSPVEFPLTVTKSMSLYLHWVKEGEIDPDDPDADVPETEYDFSRAHVFYGAVKSGDSVVGSFELKAAKGKVNRREETISVKLTATVTLLGEGKLKFKGEMDDGLSGVLVSSKRGDERELSIDFDLEEPIIRVVGNLDGYELVGSQDVFAGESPAARSIAKQVKTRVSVPSAIAFVTSTGSETVGMGSAFGLTTKADSKGRVKVSGVLPDGKKLATQGRMYWTPEGMVCPVVAPMYSKKLGGLAFSVEFLNENELAVTGWGPWIIAGKKFEEVEIESGLISPVWPLAEGSVVSCDALDEWEEQPEIVLGGKKWSFPTNPAGLRLSWTSSTGLFKGSFKVPVETESGRVKKVSATVNGAVVNGVGYGHALIKRIGTVPFLIGN